MNLKKNYLTIEELANIVSQIVLQPVSYNKEIIKVSLTSKYCLDEDLEDKTDVEIYNIVAEDGILDDFDTVIHNYYMIEKMVKEDLGIEKSITDFLNKLDTKIDEAMKNVPKDFNLKDFFSNLKKAVGDGKDI